MQYNGVAYKRKLSISPLPLRNFYSGNLKKTDKISKISIRIEFARYDVEPVFTSIIAFDLHCLLYADINQIRSSSQR